MKTGATEIRERPPHRRRAGFVYSSCNLRTSSYSSNKGTSGRNHYDLEGSTRHEQLVAFKREYGRSLELVECCLERFFPDMGEGARRDFVYTFFPMMFGIYPYTVVTDAQRAAMSEAGVDYAYMEAHDLVRASVLRLLA